MIPQISRRGYGCESNFIRLSSCVFFCGMFSLSIFVALSLSRSLVCFSLGVCVLKLFSLCVSLPCRVISFLCLFSLSSVFPSQEEVPAPKAKGKAKSTPKRKSAPKAAASKAKGKGKAKSKAAAVEKDEQAELESGNKSDEEPEVMKKPALMKKPAAKSASGSKTKSDAASEPEAKRQRSLSFKILIKGPK